MTRITFTIVKGTLDQKSSGMKGWDSRTLQHGNMKRNSLLWKLMANIIYLSAFKRWKTISHDSRWYSIKNFSAPSLSSFTLPLTLSLEGKLKNSVARSKSGVRA